LILTRVERGPRATDLFDIGRAALGWMHLAKGMGVPARRATSLNAFAKAMREGFESDGPTLIEVPLWKVHAAALRGRSPEIALIY
jgi:thiamine pyrophosphate-dependent acetolactate synthase large subunit-like protein